MAATSPAAPSPDPGARTHGQGCLHQRGISLLEVLVAIVILSLGLLGITGLQITGLKNSHTAYLRGQAAQYAYDMIDRMRVNRQAAINGNYNLAMGDSDPACGTLATCDQQEWRGQVRGLPDGNGAIAVANGKATVTVQWSEASIGGGTGTLSVESQL